VLSGCGDSRRSAVASYIKQVDQVQKALQKPLTKAAEANQGFSTKADLTKLAPQLATAQRTLERLRERVTAVKPPADAKRLSSLVTQVVDAEIDLLGQMHELATFLPGFRTTLQQVGRTSVRFHAEADAAKKTPAEESALRRYAQALTPSLSALRALKPPPVLRPTYTSAVAYLAKTQVTLDQLAASLQAGNATRAQALLEVLERAGASSDTLAAQRAQIAAVKDYDARIAHLNALEARVQREFLHLQATL
jgi:hypothetical protein